MACEDDEMNLISDDVHRESSQPVIGTCYPSSIRSDCNPPHSEESDSDGFRSPLDGPSTSDSNHIIVGATCVDFHLYLTDLPEEILERILSFLSPYKEHDSAKLVCHQWYRVIKSLIKQTRRNFYHKLSSCKVGWTQVVQTQGMKNSGSAGFRVLSISERYSHSCAYLKGSMYVFGGCTNTNTTFNDLWRLDLTSRRWMRPVAMGSYPSPKACATMVVYKGRLVLFGGWSHPIPYPLHQSANYFNELHVYDPESNRWSLLVSIGIEPVALGGHSASVIKDTMVVFGGSPRSGQGSNKVWVYDFLKNTWLTPTIKGGVAPEPRFGQYQCTLDDGHILVTGGCGGPHKIYNDFYLLTLDSVEGWYWTKLQVQHPELAPRQAWWHSVCKVEDKLVVLCKSAKPRESLNVSPSVFYVEAHLKQNYSCKDKNPPQPTATTDATTPSPEAETWTNSALDTNASDTDPSVSGESLSSSNNRNLLALQQRLHREYVNLTDQHNHQHNPHPENNIPEGQIHRIQNRIGQQGDDIGNPQPLQQNQPQQQLQYFNAQSPSPHHHQNQQHRHILQRVENSPPLQEHNQPHAGQLRRPNPQALRESVPMPSIRPNSSSNRQKQLEALQRQEELLRSKSKALAEARKKAALDNSSPMEEDIPKTVIVKNRMDVHVVDISTALTDGSVDWKPESHMLPVGAPTDTICNSLVEGRAELIFFGGVAREPKVPLDQNTALNKLYILHT